MQDSLLFDRGVGVIGYPFNQSGIGNNADALSLGTREDLVGQALSNLNVGRTNQNQGYGGLVLSAGNESINILIRALQDRNALRILSKPSLTTIDNLLARVQVGAQVPYITLVSQNPLGGFNNSVELVSVGIILEIVPRVSPDGTIVLTVNATNSSLGDEADGVAISVDAQGNTVRQPQINTTTAETTVMAKSGQTVVFSGLLQEIKTDVRRGVPYLSDLPVLGPLFRFDQEGYERTELLIVMTPYLVDSDEQIELANQVEMDRMNWCLCDVTELYGSLGYDDSEIAYGVPNGVGHQTEVYYPDSDPTAQRPQLIGNGNQALPETQQTPEVQNVPNGQNQGTQSSPRNPIDSNQQNSLSNLQQIDSPATFETDSWQRENTQRPSVFSR